MIEKYEGRYEPSRMSVHDPTIVPISQLTPHSSPISITLNCLFLAIPSSPIIIPYKIFYSNYFFFQQCNWNHHLWQEWWKIWSADDREMMKWTPGAHHSLWISVRCKWCNAVPVPRGEKKHIICQAHWSNGPDTVRPDQPPRSICVFEGPK